ncbi:DUF3168 domain-containing protein [Bacteroides propionicifaciens]|uniref:DUF3168 domain-containing protein n=1 Tax=Bacteroides propionicifaciens TaxID=392838 RepID=UPI00036D6E21|nr:DUF3168 domain-containing protein [Bacteroides propionicifaciens]
MSAESKFKVTTRIRTALLKSPEISKNISGVFPIVAPKNTVGDFIIYQRDQYSKEYTKMGIYKEQCRVYITAISESYDKSQELAYQINECLEGVHHDLNMSIKLIDSTEDFEDAKYIQTLLFEVE